MTPHSGSVQIDGEELYELDDHHRSDLRNETVGFELVACVYFPVGFCAATGSRAREAP